MARTGTRILDTGDKMPEIGFATVSGGNLALPDDIKGHWTVFLVYRGDW